MATVTSRNCCLVCGKEKATYKCDGCLKRYCKTHLQDHQNELELELDKFENERNIFRQTFSEHIEQPNRQYLIQQINEWEQRSIKKINRTAEQNRQLVITQTNEHFEKIEGDLKHLTDEIKETRQDNDFNELNLNNLRNKLKKLQEKLDHPEGIVLREDTSSSFINRIYVDGTNDKLFRMLNIPATLQWKQNAITIAGGNNQGAKLNQTSNPWGICMDAENTIYIADTSNHRILEWKNGATSGTNVAGGNGPGNGNNQLKYPEKVIWDHTTNSLIISDRCNRRIVRLSYHNDGTTQRETIISNVCCWGLAMDKYGYLYGADIEKHEVRRWKLGEDECGVVVAGGNDVGGRLDQLKEPRYIFVDEEQSVYVSENKNHRVMKWCKGAKNGIVVAGGNDAGKSVRQLSNPQGIFVDRLGTVYVADLNNHRIMRWLAGAKEGSLISGEGGRGRENNQLDSPTDLIFDDKNNLYVADRDNQRIQKFIVDN